MAMCEEDPVLRSYVPDGGIPDREFLVQVLATLALPALIEKQKEVLSKKYRIAAETDLEADSPFYIPQEFDEKAFLASAMPE